MKNIWTIVLIILVFVFSSCTPERRVAKRFLGSEKTIPVLIIEPDFVFKKNRTAEYTIEGFNTFSEKKKDSLQIAESKFLKDIESEKIIEDFNRELFKTLAKYPNIEIYNSSNMNQFLQKGEKGYIFNFTQVLLEEYIKLFRDSTYYNGRKYVQEFDNDAITANFWVEITETNNPEEKMKVAFTSVHTYDKISGYFNYDLFTGDVKYNFSLNELELNKIYGMLNYSATKNARLIFNYILNDKIMDIVIPNPNNEIYYHYDPERKSLTRSYGNKYKYYFIDK